MSSFVSTMRQNRNLFDGQFESKIINNDGTIVSNQSYSTSINFIEVDGRVFTCSKANTSTEGFRIALYDAEKTFLKRLVLGANELSVTVNEPTAIYIKFCVQYTSVAGMQVELGDKATSYVPYGLEKVSHVVTTLSNKNLFDVDTYGDCNQWDRTTYRYLPIYVGDGTTVTVSHKTNLSLGTGAYFLIGYQESHKGNIGGEWMLHNSSAASIRTSVTVTAIGDYIYLTTYGDATTINNLVLKDDFMIEIGSSRTAYEPYHKHIKHLIASKEVTTNV